MKSVWLIAESQYFPDTEEMVAYATVHRTKDGARRALRRQMRQVVAPAYEGDDDVDIGKELDEIFERADPDASSWEWGICDRLVKWRMFRQEVRS